MVILNFHLLAVLKIVNYDTDNIYLLITFNKESHELFFSMDQQVFLILI